MISKTVVQKLTAMLAECFLPITETSGQAIEEAYIHKRNTVYAYENFEATNLESI